MKPKNIQRQPAQPVIKVLIKFRFTHLLNLETLTKCTTNDEGCLSPNLPVDVLHHSGGDTANHMNYERNCCHKRVGKLEGLLQIKWQVRLSQIYKHPGGQVYNGYLKIKLRYIDSIKNWIRFFTWYVCGSLNQSKTDIGSTETFSEA